METGNEYIGFYGSTTDSQEEEYKYKYEYYQPNCNTLIKIKNLPIEDIYSWDTCSILCSFDITRGSSLVFNPRKSEVLVTLDRPCTP